MHKTSYYPTSAIWHGVKVGPGLRNSEPREPGTRYPGLASKFKSGIRDILKVYKWDSGPPSKFKSDTQAPPSKIKSGTSSSLFNEFILFGIFHFFYLFIFLVFFK